MILRTLFSVKNTKKTPVLHMGLLLLCMVFSLHVNAQNTAQNITVKGEVFDGLEPLQGVNIILQGANIGTTTNKKGAFTFPKPLKVGDVLLFSYLGYDTKTVNIAKNKSFISLKMEADTVEIIGELNPNTPYKSNRSK